MQIRVKLGLLSVQSGKYLRKDWKDGMGDIWVKQEKGCYKKKRPYQKWVASFFYQKKGKRKGILQKRVFIEIFKYLSC